MPPPVPEHLAALADACGVATSYTGADDRRVDVPAETVRALLEAMDVDAGDERSAERELARVRAERAQRLVPPAHVARRGDPGSWAVPAGAVAEAAVELEGGGLRELGAGSPLGLPADLPAGHHRLRARAGTAEAEGALVVAPARAPLPAQRLWGWMAQLYQLRSAASWGMGDAADLATLAARSAAELDAGFVVCNPLHAATPVPPIEPSPYFPSSRRFADPLYLRVEDVPERAGLDADDAARLAALAEQARALNGSDRIDRDAVFARKREALELLHRAPRPDAREAAFAAYRRRRGQALSDFATFCALAERHGRIWQRWPAELRHPRGAAVEAARAELADRIDFHAWLQWLLDEQLAGAQRAATDAGMPIGVIGDLAVGVDPGGADAWTLQDELAGDVRVGAPPDAFNQRGQDWRLPPLRPDRLAETGFAPVREMLAGVLAGAGGVRIDHVMGLFRLFWIPDGAEPTAGTYVRYPGEQLLGVLALEAERAGAVVVGEDLGTVEPGLRDRLRGAGVLGSSVVYFERDDDGEPVPPDDYPELALASVTTHDLPTAAGWWRDEALRLQAELGLLGEGRTLKSELARAEAEREAVRALLRAEGLAADDADTAELVAAMHALLARTPSLLAAASPADAVGDLRQPNLPGTDDEYPNWRLPLAEPAGDGHRPVGLEELLAHPGTRRLADILRRR